MKHSVGTQLPEPVAILPEERNILVLNIPVTSSLNPDDALGNAQCCWRISESKLRGMDLILATVTEYYNNTGYRVVVDAFEPHGRQFETKRVLDQRTGQIKTAFIGKRVADAGKRARLVGRRLIFDNRLPSNPIYYLDEEHQERRTPYLQNKSI